MSRKIVFYIAGLQRGGAERVLSNLANFFSWSGYEVTVFTDCFLEKEYALDARIRREKVGYEPTGRRLTDAVKRIAVLRDAYRRVSPDVVVSFIGKANIRAILASPGTGIPVVVSVRNLPEKEYRTAALRLLAKTLFGFAAGVVFQTREARDWFGARVRKRAVILPNFLQESVMRPRYEGERQNEIVAVGRLVKAKNHRLLLQAFAQIAGEFPDTVLRIYGDGAERGALEQDIARQGLQRRAFLMGDCEAIPDRICRARLFVLPSDYEGMPNALLEAMALGLPVIASDCPCGGPRAVIRNGENGILVQTGDVAALSGAMRRLLSDPAFADRLGRCASRIQEELAPERVSRAWQTYLEGVMRA